MTQESEGSNIAELAWPGMNKNSSESVLDSGHGQIRPRARLIRTLGAELISSEIVAVIELIRNCYDADASRVTLRFSNPHLPEEARLSIEDNGHGMTREILLGPWLEPATDYKASNSRGGLGGARSPRGRRRLGSKGVGRFAVQRLGGVLDLETRTTRRENLLQAHFDWKMLDRADCYLDELSIPWREIAGPPWRTSGTRLHIRELRDKWTPERFDKLRLALSRLVGPGMGSDPFSIHLVINEAREEIKPAIDSLPSMYSIKGEVAWEGVCTLTWSDISGEEEEWERTVLWPQSDKVCGPFKFEIKAWDLDREALQFYLQKVGRKDGLRDFRRLIRDHSGISLYRDGFRILPYGEPDNDWLRLDRRRVNNPTMRLSNNQILGRVYLSADENEHLRDQTNREGLVSNEAYIHLQNVVLELLGYLENRRFVSRRKMPLGSRGDVSSLPVMDDSHEVRVATLLDSLEKEGNRKGSARELRQILEERKQQTTEALNQYASLAAGGQLAGLVFGQLRHPMRRLKSEVESVLYEVEEAELTKDEREVLVEGVSRLKRIMVEMATRVERVDPLVNLRKGRRRIKTNLVDVLGDVRDAFLDELAQREVDAQLILGDEQKPVLTDPAVVQQVAAILLDNAMYWLMKSKGPRILQIKLMEDGFTVQNNGPAIPSGDMSHIFDPWFTTREDAAGMGLTLARDLLAGVGGQIKAIQKKKGVAFKVVLQ